MADTQAARLDRIEEKIDRLSDAMIALARAEQKLINIEEKYNSQFERINRFSQKLDCIEGAVNEANRTISVINKFFWIAVVAATSAIAAQYFM
jgi:anti-sigma-K factor RskA